VDKDTTKIDALKRGKIPIYEPDLDRIVETNVREGRLSFTTELADAVGGDEAVFIAVSTPRAAATVMRT
jgi:UDPglucose 6-dehydrogenase